MVCYCATNKYLLPVMYKVDSRPIDEWSNEPAITKYLNLRNDVAFYRTGHTMRAASRSRKFIRG